MDQAAGLVTSLDTTSIHLSLFTEARNCVTLQIRCQGPVLGVLVSTNYQLDFYMSSPHKERTVPGGH